MTARKFSKSFFFSDTRRKEKKLSYLNLNHQTGDFCDLSISSATFKDNEQEAKELSQIPNFT